MGSATVVIPCLDLGGLLLEAVESVRAQTLAPAEIIVVDDGSTEPETLAVLGRLEREGVTVLRTEHRGASAARNTGIERAASDYVLCLDGDDVLLPSFLERTVPVLDARPDVAIVTTHVELFGERTGLWETSDFDPVRLLFENCIAGASLFRRACWRGVGGYPDLESCQDWSFWLSIVERDFRWTVVPEPLYRYRVRRGSISDRGRDGRADVLRRLVELHPAAYRDHTGHLLAAVDQELRALRERVAVYEEESTAQVETIAGLRRALRERETGLVYEDVVHRVADAAAALPEDATVLVVSRGDDGLLELAGRRGRHFPQDGDGVYAGHHPPTGAAAVEHLEAQRVRGAQFLLLPATELWWLDHYAELRERLVSRYPAVSFAADTGAVFDLRRAVEPRSFSVVVCTYNRVELLPAAIESVLDQLYPADRCELIVVDNGSTDGTAEVVRRYLVRPGIPVSYVVEPRNGLSHARNAGIARAGHEYVAFLDDDAVASPTWLAAFNDVVDRRDALVVGGRVERELADGVEPPAWLAEQYVRGFFELDYRAWGKRESVFRIRRPLYLAGGNSAYARRLFDRFGGFRTDLGRNGRTLLAGEETYLNLELERHDVPIYYTDLAVVRHRIASDRLTKRHVLRKAYWGGVSNALVETLALDPREARAHARRCLVDLARGARTLLARQDEAVRFPVVCRIGYDLGFVRTLAALSLSGALGRRRRASPPATWTLEDSIRETSAWPASAERDKRLYNLYLAAGREDDARAALERLAERLPASALPDPDGPLVPFGDALPQSAYGGLVERIREVVRASVPSESKVIVVSKGDPRLVDLDGRQAWHFPQDERGAYAGYYPADSDNAIAQLEQLRARGGDYLLLPSTASWWLDHYDGLARHLERHYRLVRRGEPCQIFDLSGSGAAGGAG